MPEAFGSYRVLEAIGAGRFGFVYRARDGATGLEAVVKLFDQELTTDQAAQLAAAIERLSGAPLDHPGIVPVLTAGTDAERVWAAEPWIEGVPLDILMRREGLLPTSEVALRVTQVAGALDFAAAAGIFHGALHPRDILVSRDRARVVGVGVLQALSDAGLAVPMQGAYVSPQREQGAPVAQGDDIFALAAIAYELTYGVPVPPRSELRSALSESDRRIDNAVVEVIERALSPEVDERPASALAFAAALQEALSRTPAVAATPYIQAVPAVEPTRSIAPAPRVEPPRSIAPAPPVERVPQVERAPHVEVGPRVDPDIVSPRVVPDFEPEVDLPLRAAEPEREPEPKPIAVPVMGSREPTIPVSAAAVAAATTSSEPGLWFPISATLAIGLLMGFASGYFVGQRDSTPAPHAAERPVARRQQTDAPQATSGRDFTDSVVPPPQPVTEAPVTPVPETPSTNGPRESGAAASPARPDASEPGSLQIDSRPRGARVFVDGRLAGTTPLVVADVTPGPHTVRIDLRGHRSWVTSVDVAAGVRQRVAASLEQ